VLTGSFLRAIPLAALLLIPGRATTQEIVPVTLSLEEAIEIARSNNPSFQAMRNNEALADWDVKAAYGSLLPSASTNFSLSWQGAGEQTFGSLTAEQLGLADQPSFMFSRYGLDLNYSINGTTLLAPGQAKVNRVGTRADVAFEAAELISQVTLNYIEVLRQTEQARVSEQQRERARFNLRLVQAQLEVGIATAVDAAQAEVALGRSEVTVLRTSNALQTARIRLLQRLGVDLDSPFVPTTPFVLSEPPWSRNELVSLGLEASPTLQAIRAFQSVSSYGVKMAKSAYLPTLSLSAGLRGFTRQASSSALNIQQAEAQAQGSIQNCLFTNDLFARLADPLPAQDCSAFAFTDNDARGIEDDNRSFPFDFTGQPASASLTISLPLFQGLDRQRQVTEAQVQLEDRDYQYQEAELALRADISVNLATVRAAYQAALIEEQNQIVADEQLRLARERFSVGLADFLELLEAETLKVEADREQIAAIFAYHDSLANLEAVVGTSLRIQ
jgi:outer membrane protein